MANMPTIHLTKRAVEWLTKSPTVYGGGFTYHEPVGYYACGAVGPSQAWHDTAHRLSLSTSADLKSGVEDVRGLYLGKDYKVIQVAGDYRRYKKVKVRTPTCGTCQILLSQAIEQSCYKTGVYPDVDHRGNLKWRTVKAQQYTAPAEVGLSPGQSPKDKADE